MTPPLPNRPKLDRTDVIAKCNDTVTDNNAATRHVRITTPLLDVSSRRHRNDIYIHLRQHFVNSCPGSTSTRYYLDYSRRHAIDYLRNRPPTTDCLRPTAYDRHVIDYSRDRLPATDYSRLTTRDDRLLVTNYSRPTDKHCSRY